MRMVHQIEYVIESEDEALEVAEEALKRARMEEQHDPAYQIFLRYQFSRTRVTTRIDAEGNLQKLRGQINQDSWPSAG